jgi:hypothetical protein
MGMRAPQAPGVPKPPLPEFQAQRQKVTQRLGADAQGQQDAMARKLAAGGMLNSGAAVKQQALIGQNAAQTREDALQQVDAAEMGEQQRRQEIMDQRDFAANEAKLGRDFQGSESAMARALQAGQFDRQFGMSEKQFDADRQDQMRNIAVSMSNLKGDQREKYDAALAEQGFKPAPGAAPMAAPKPKSANPYAVDPSTGQIKRDRFGQPVRA